MLLRFTTVALTLAALCFADTLTLRSGQVIQGEYLGGDARHIRMAVGDRVNSYDVSDVGTLQFGSGNAAQNSQQPAYQDRQQNPGQYQDRGRDQGFAQQPPPPATDQRYQAPPPPPGPTYTGVQIPAGTPITIRMIDNVDSTQSRLGQTFKASIDEPVSVNGQTVIPRGADAMVKLVQDQQSGKFQGRTVLTLVLTDITINGQIIDTTTGDVTQASASRGSRTAKVVGGATALGAIIGALAGGGRGAAIGAASGAAVGGGAQVLTKGQQVKIPSETRLTFTLQQPIQF